MFGIGNEAMKCFDISGSAGQAGAGPGGTSNRYQASKPNAAALTAAWVLLEAPSLETTLLI